MKTISMKDKWIILTLTAIVGVALSLGSIWNDLLVNPDGILYLRIAYVYSHQGFAQAMALYPWPFYGIAIAYLQQVFSLDYFTAAYTLNISLHTLLVIAFLLIVAEFEINKRTLIFAALTILTFSKFNDYRSSIIRDFGYWAFYLTALLHFIRYAKYDRWCNLLLWNLAIVVATLFRIEGAVFFLFAPMILFFLPQETHSQRLTHLFRAYGVLCVLGLVALLLATFMGHNLIQFGRVTEVKKEILHGTIMMYQSFQSHVKAMADDVLNEYSADFAVGAVLAFLISYYIKKILSSITIFYGILIGYTWVNKLTHQAKVNRVLIGFIVINVLITFMFLLQMFFMSGRYMLAMGLTAVVWVPFALDKIYLNWHAKSPSLTGKTWLFPLIILFMLLSVMSSMVSFGPNKQHIRRAIHWMQDNIPSQSSLYSPNTRIVFMVKGPASKQWQTHLPENYRIENTGDWKQYDYLAFTFSRHHVDEIKRLERKLGLLPYQEFSGSRGEKVLIFKTK